MAGDEGYGEITSLPEGCISHAISLTSPVDSCRSAVVSTTFRSAVDSVWEHFLPSDYEEILSRAIDPVEFSSKKELYFRLSDSILIDEGRISFRLERSTGRKCYTLSARELDIDGTRHWKWKHLEDSRFSEIALLVDLYWLQIKGSMDCKVLSRRTNYAAYLIFEIPPNSDLLAFYKQHASVSVGSNNSTNVVWFYPPEGEDNNEVVRAPNARLDGWMELELGEFFSGDGDDGNVEISLIDNGPWKRGLILEGIEVRPK